MRRYFFDVNRGIGLTDTIGCPLEDRDAAREHAIQIAADYAARVSATAENSGAVIVTVRTDKEGVVLTLRLAFDIEMPNGN